MPEPVDPLALARNIADRLCVEAIRSAGRATWLGDEKENVTGEWEVVHRSVDGDLYGGTAGIGLFLGRIFTATGEERYRTTALEAFAHAVEWCRRTRPSGSLYVGSAGLAAALAEAAGPLGSGALAEEARRITLDAIEHPPAESDFLGGRAGSIVALLHIARTLHIDHAFEAAQAHGAALSGDAITELYPGACWASDTGSDEPPLCGLAHGASGIALALAELAHVCGDERSAELARAAAEYERAWFRRETGNWPDLREYTRTKKARGEAPAFPNFWCHGAVGIGLVRLRQYALTGETIYAVEAETALLSAEKYLALCAEGGVHADLSLCHGLAGLVELFLAGAHVLEQPELHEQAMACVQLAALLGREGAGPWPCGVPEGGENPSLMLGLAGIGMMFLRASDPMVAPIGLPYTANILTSRVIVRLRQGETPIDVQARVQELLQLVPGSRVERISGSGRILLRLAASTPIETAIEALSAHEGVEYAEPDVIDRASSP